MGRLSLHRPIGLHSSKSLARRFCFEMVDTAANFGILSTSVVANTNAGGSWSSSLGTNPSPWGSQRFRRVNLNVDAWSTDFESNERLAVGVDDAGDHAAPDRGWGPISARETCAADPPQQCLIVVIAFAIVARYHQHAIRPVQVALGSIPRLHAVGWGVWFHSGLPAADSRQRR